MEENLHKDNLEEFFKNSFNEEKFEPSDDQWDVPSNAVWTGINESINPVTPFATTTSVFNLKWLMVAAASLLVFGLVYYNFTLQKQVGELTEIIENQDNTIKELEKKILKNGLTEDGNGRQEDGNGGWKDTKSEDGVNKNGELREGGNVEELSSIMLENSASKTSSKTFSESNSQIISNQNDSQNNSSSRQNGEKKKSVNKSQTTDPLVEKSDIKKDIAERNQKAEAASIVAIEEDAKAKNVQSEESILKQENQNLTTPSLSEFQKNSMAILAPLSSKTTFVEAHAQADEITLDILPVPEEIFKQSPSSAARTGFYVGAHLAPTYGYRNIKSINGPVLRRLLNKQEQAVYSVAIGMKAGYQFSKNWSVETGLNYFKNTVDSRHVAQVRYESQIERLNSDGSYDSNYQLRLSTSYGEIETDVALTRSSDTQIDQNDYINLVLRTRQELKNLAVPVAIRYRTAGNKFHFSAKAGISTNFIIQKDVTVKAAAVNRNGIQHRRTIIDKQFSGLKNTTFDVLFGIGLDYDISKNWSIYFEPTATHSINPVYNLNGKIKTYPIVASLNIGLAYRF